MLLNLAGILVALAAIVLTYYKWRYQYWSKRKFPTIEPQIPYGSFKNTGTNNENPALTLARIYQEVRRKGLKHVGLYGFLSGVPLYFPVDLEYIKNIMAKDFQYFADRGMYYNEKDDPLSAHLLAIEGVKWKKLRSKISPTFTSGRMKMMFPLMVECESTLHQRLEQDIEGPIDIKEVLCCFTTDVIGSCAFGLELKAAKEKNSPFRSFGKKVFQATGGLKQNLTTAFPGVSRKLGIKSIPEDAAEFFLGVVKDTLEYRARNNYVRDDFIQLLIQMQKEGDGLTLEETAAQCFIFFTAGFETSATTVTFTLYELSRNQDIQEKLREEIDEVLQRHGGKITYEAIHEMKYMNQVVDEALRMYPPAPMLIRNCVKDYKIPGEDLVIEKGTLVIFSVLGIHHNEETYPEPEKFDPERFTEENKNARHGYSHIPFGEGPRACIGLRFGLIQSKVALASLLRKYRFTVNNKTVEPLKMVRKSLFLAVDGELWLNAERV